MIEEKHEKTNKEKNNLNELLLKTVTTNSQNLFQLYGLGHRAQTMP
jgi:hypothetical protein